MTRGVPGPHPWTAMTTVARHKLDKRPLILRILNCALRARLMLPSDDIECTPHVVRASADHKGTLSSCDVNFDL